MMSISLEDGAVRELLWAREWAWLFIMRYRGVLLIESKTPDSCLSNCCWLRFGFWYMRLYVSQEMSVVILPVGVGLTLKSRGKVGCVGVATQDLQRHSQLKFFLASLRRDKTYSVKIRGMEKTP